MDFVRFLSPNAGEGTLVGTGRVTTAVLTVIAVTWAPQISNFETLWAYFQSAVSFLTPSLVAVFVVGIFWRKTNGVAAIVASLSLGVAATAVRVYLCGGSS